jgi:hypothetical protein
MLHKLIETEDGCLSVENDVPHMLDGVFIHWDIYKWCPSRVRAYKKMWLEITDYLKDKGIKGIYALPPSPFEEKLIKMFNFKDTGLTYHGFKIMRYERWVS